MNNTTNNMDPSMHAMVLRCSDTAPELVRSTFLEAGWAIYDEETMEPEGWNVWWRSSRFKASMYDSANSYQKMNHFLKSGVVTRKDQLLRSIRGMQRVHGKIFDIIPETFILPMEYTKFVRAYADQELGNSPDDTTNSSGKKAGHPWICKPADLSRGRKIFLLNSLSDLRYDQKCVIQKYIPDPLTIGGYKVDLRVYVCVTSFHPLKVFLYREGLARFGSEKYDENMTDIGNLFSHLTNSSINKYSSTYGTSKDVIGSGCKWTFTTLREWFAEQGIDFEPVWKQIQSVVVLTLLGAVTSIPQNDSCFELFGFDILLDKKLKPWLIEVNCAPALGVTSDADREAKGPLIRDLVKLLDVKPFDASSLKRLANSRHKKVIQDRRRVGRSTPVFCSSSSTSVAAQRKRQTPQPTISSASTLSPTTTSNRTSLTANKEDNETTSNAPALDTGVGGVGNGSIGDDGALTDVDGSMSNLELDGWIPGSAGKFELAFPFNHATVQLAREMKRFATAKAGGQKALSSCIRQVITAMRQVERDVQQQQKQQQAYPLHTPLPAASATSTQITPDAAKKTPPRFAKPISSMPNYFNQPTHTSKAELIHKNDEPIDLGNSLSDVLCMSGEVDIGCGNSGVNGDAVLGVEGCVNIAFRAHAHVDGNALDGIGPADFRHSGIAAAVAGVDTAVASSHRNVGVDNDVASRHSGVGVGVGANVHNRRPHMLHNQPWEKTVDRSPKEGLMRSNSMPLAGESKKNETTYDKQLQKFVQKQRAPDGLSAHMGMLAFDKCESNTSFSSNVYGLCREEEIRNIPTPRGMKENSVLSKTNSWEYENRSGVGGRNGEQEDNNNDNSKNNNKNNNNNNNNYNHQNNNMAGKISCGSSRSSGRLCNAAKHALRGDYSNS